VHQDFCMTERGAQQRGFALLIVLGILSVAALFGALGLASGRVEIGLATNLRATAALAAVADGAVYAATFHLIAGDWSPDGVPRLVRVGPGVAQVSVADLGGRLNPNTAPLPVMRQLLIGVGATPQQATEIAAAMADWQNPSDEPLAPGARAQQYRAAGRDYVPTGRPFRNLDEIGLVLGMTPTLLAALAPHVSVYQEGQADLQRADPVVAEALAADEPPLVSTAAEGKQRMPLVVEVTVTAVARSGARVTRRAVVRIGAVTAGNPSPWRVLDWE
jgi:general secretion pathway protein K